MHVNCALIGRESKGTLEKKSHEERTDDQLMYHGEEKWCEKKLFVVIVLMIYVIQYIK